MTALEDLLTVLHYVILPHLKLLEIRALLLTSKSLYTALTPSMETVYQTHFPNEPGEPRISKREFYWIRRFLTRSGASQVYLWGKDWDRELSLGLSDPTNHLNYGPAFFRRLSEILSRLGVKKFTVKGEWFVVLSLDGNVYIVFKGNEEYISKVFECPYPNDYFVDIATAFGGFIALSNTGRLYAWDEERFFEFRRRYKLEEVDLGRALELPNNPRVLSITPCSSYGYACLVEDVGVVMTLRDVGEQSRNYAPRVLILPKVSDSLELGWKVAEMAFWHYGLVLRLDNGLVYTVQLGHDPLVPKPELLNLSEPIERLWCNDDHIFLLTRAQILFQITPDNTYRDGDFLLFGQRRLRYNKSKVEGIDGAHINTIAIVSNHIIALMDDSTLYVWGRMVKDSGRAAFGLGQHATKISFEPVKIKLEHVVYVTVHKEMSGAIIIDPMKPGTTKTERWFSRNHGVYAKAMRSLDTL